MNRLAVIFFLIFNFFIRNFLFSQIEIKGKITDNQGNIIPYVSVCVNNFENCTSADKDGFYSITVKPYSTVNLIFFQIGYDTLKIKLKVQNQNLIKNIVLNQKMQTVDIIQAIAQTVNETGLERINTQSITLLPSLSGNAVEGLVKLNMGVSNTNELSSQYNVRGGNFDENLIYVNDIQIYRPFLVRSGQQEGMSFINSDLVSSIQFSAGGFDAKYDDRMSSVLAVKYKIPKEFSAKLGLNLLGGSFSVENASKNQKFTFLAGVRYRQFSYLFSTLQIKGDYKPKFGDFQTFITFTPKEKIRFSFLGNMAQNVYLFIPQSQTQSFGSFSQPLQINIFYNGKEKDSYKTLFGAFAIEYRPKKNFFLKSITSAFYSVENEKFDIEALYNLNAIDKELGSETYGDSLLNLGSGGYLTHARNYLTAQIFSQQFKANWFLNGNKILFGIKANNEIIRDNLNEWKYIDSAGYCISSTSNRDTDVIYLFDFVSASNYMNTYRFSAYLQNTKTFYNISNDIKITAGLRVSYWTYNNEWLFSPRFAMLFNPYWDKKWYFRFATGVYYQSPFYRELRTFNGELVKNPKSQRSIHFLAGSYYTFKIWKRPFKFSAEAYYKKLDNLIPYELDNLRIRYYADQKAKGYAIGLDLKLYGEFVKGTDSWFTLSILRTAEDIYGDYYYQYLDKNGNPTYNIYEIVDTVRVYPEYIPRPTDRRISASIYFQDYMPGLEQLKVNLAFYFSTPFPYGPPQTARYRATLRSFPPYMRADLGFSYLLKSPSKNYNNNFLNKFREIWLGIDIFNIFDIKNTASYNWLYLVPNTTNPLPLEYQMIATRNTLTGRIFNLKIIVVF